MPTPADPTPRCVLIVDDDPFFHTVLREMLTHLGVPSIHTAADGSEALQVLNTLDPAPDVLICDVFMPTMDGVEFLAQLGSRHFGGGILLVSGVDANMLDLSRVIGIDSGLRVLGAYIKPLTLQQLSHALGCAPPDPQATQGLP